MTSVGPLHGGRRRVSHLAMGGGDGIPDRVMMEVEGLGEIKARLMARDAVEYARREAPKLSGRSSKNFYPIYGNGWFGIAWMDRYVWLQDQGISAFTNKNLAGKVIPMWVDDPGGQVKAKNPKAKQRTTVAGRIQTLIFRRAAKIGQRKKVKQDDGTYRTVPASYPGAPGRISKRNLRQPWTAPGRVGGWIARGNVGVRWRHPGLNPREFIEYGMTRAVVEHGYQATAIIPVNSSRAGRVGALFSAATTRRGAEVK